MQALGFASQLPLESIAVKKRKPTPARKKRRQQPSNVNTTTSGARAVESAEVLPKRELGAECALPGTMLQAECSLPGTMLHAEGRLPGTVLQALTQNTTILSPLRPYRPLPMGPRQTEEAC